MTSINDQKPEAGSETPMPSKKKAPAAKNGHTKAEKAKRNGRKKVAATNGNSKNHAVEEVTMVSAPEATATPPVEEEEVATPSPSRFSNLGVKKNGVNNADLLPPPPPAEMTLGEALGELNDVATTKYSRSFLMTTNTLPQPELPPELAKNLKGDGSYASPLYGTCENIKVAYISDVGQVRSNNQDSATAVVGTIPATNQSPAMLFGFFAVADGMGGHDKGEVASNLVIRTSVDGVLKEFYRNALAGNPPGGGERSPSEIIVDIIEDGNVAIIREANAQNLTMGTTMSCVVVLGSMAYIGHIGDSRLYAMEKQSSQLLQLSEDHSVVARLVATGHLTPEEAADSPQRSMLYRSLGTRPGTLADSDYVYLNDYSHLLICSDGLWDMVTNDKIEQTLKQSDDPVEICRSLVDAANAAGGEDNVTVLVVKL